MRILICDDDTGFSRQLREILITFFRENSLKLPEVIIYDSGEELLKDPGSKDIVFLDIEMPGMNGICAGNELFIFSVPGRCNAFPCVPLSVKAFGRTADLQEYERRPGFI